MRPCAIALLMGHVLWLGGGMTGLAQTRQAMELARQRMVRQVLIESGITDPQVIKAMAATPRHEFVSRVHRKNAYFDMALPIGEGQTISSPFIVAYMTQSLDPKPTDKVLEIGTGSGYQAAVLSHLVSEVFTIEIVRSLSVRASRTLQRLRYQNVHTRMGDGYAGWPEHAPFDKIIVTCSPEKVPPALVQQLREGGRMVVPVGQRYQQTLYLFRKTNGSLESEALRPTLFVPMTGQAESKRQIHPDPLHPRVVNGGFEEPPEDGQIPGWYYQRQLEVVVADKAPEGRQYLAFHNQTPGRPSRALQGLGIDGRHVKTVTVTCWIKTDDVLPGPGNDMAPVLAVTFYDEDRRDLGSQWLGPWRDSRPWERASATLQVPVAAREAIVRIGLFGAVGTFSIDDIRFDVPNR